MRLRRDRRGAVALEFALFAPVLIFLVLATFDLVTLYRVQMRLDAAAAQIGQIASQCNRFTTPGDTGQFWAHAERIVGGSNVITGAAAQGAMILSAVYSVNNANRVAWQQRTGSALHASSVGTAGNRAQIGENFLVPANQTLLVTEIFVPRQAWVLSSAVMGDNLLPSVLYGVSLFATRSPDAIAIQTPPTASANPDCTS
jgi:Flp pilus assembly protein TadG